MYKTIFKPKKTFTDIYLFLRIRKMDNNDFHHIKTLIDNINPDTSKYDNISVELTTELSNDNNITMKLTEINKIREVFEQLDNSFKN
jgi:hypothetical protein